MAIDRRLLDIRLCVHGVANDSAETINGLQYIVGINPTGNFAAATPNDLAVYDGRKGKWIFYKPFTDMLEIMNVETGKYQRWNGIAWEDITPINNNEPEDPVVIFHNNVSGIQGGKTENGVITEAYHMTREEWLKLPIKPSVIYPNNNAIDINQVPQIQGSPYVHPHDIPMYGKSIQVATDIDFSTPLVYEAGELSSGIVFQIPVKADNSFYLTENTTYYVRIRYQDEKGRWSDWSDPISFTTLATFPDSIIAAPVMAMPQYDAIVPEYNTVLAMTVPIALTGAVSFISSDWQVATDAAFTQPVLYEALNSSDITLHLVAGLTLSAAPGVEFYARGRSKTSIGDYSPWTIPTKFRCKPDYTYPIFGFRRIFPTTTYLTNPTAPIQMHHLDKDGNIIYLPESYFNRHPLYRFMQYKVYIGKDTNDSDAFSEMVLIPPIWEKNNVYTNSDGDLVIDLWFSPSPMPASEGWFLDPAFLESPGGILYGRGVSEIIRIQTNTGTANVLKASLLHSEGISWDSYLKPGINYINSLPGQAGWHFSSIYENRLVYDLIQAHLLTQSKSQVILGTGKDIYKGMYAILTRGGGYYYSLLSTGMLVKPQVNTIQIIIPPSFQNVRTYSLTDIDGNIFNTDGTYIGHIREIHTGAIPELGNFDVALLRIPKKIKRLSANTGSATANSAPFYGHADFYSGHGTYKDPTLPIGNCCDYSHSMFGFLSFKFAGNAMNVRLVKHLIPPPVGTDPIAPIIFPDYPITYPHTQPTVDVIAGDNVTVEQVGTEQNKIFKINIINTPTPTP